MTKWAYIKFKNQADREANRGVVYDIQDSPSNPEVQRNMRAEETNTTGPSGYWKECSDSTGLGDAYDGNGNWISEAEYHAGRNNNTINW
jgi:hypothetical protein